MYIVKNESIFDLKNPIPIYKPVLNNGLTCFGRSPAQYKLIFDYPKCFEITFIPHCHGTHVESIAHLNGNSVETLKICEENDFLISKLYSSKSCSVIECVMIKTENTHLDANFVESLFEIYPNLKCLAVDHFSVDPEWDDGKLEAHNIFFNKGGLLIIENCSFEYVLYDHIYLMCINAGPFAGTDAVPARPTLYNST